MVIYPWYPREYVISTYLVRCGTQVENRRLHIRSTVFSFQKTEFKKYYRVQYAPETEQLLYRDRLDVAMKRNWIVIIRSVSRGKRLILYMTVSQQAQHLYNSFKTPGFPELFGGGSP